MSSEPERPAAVSSTTGVVITIDGPAGAGKSTAAGLLAAELGFCLLDSGALYRVLALHLLRRGVSPDAETVHPDALAAVNVRIMPRVGAMAVFLGDEDVSADIRKETIGAAASLFSARPEVRRALIGLQRSAVDSCNIVAEGRDMGTVVFPGAPIKFFLTAALNERALRRYLELSGRGLPADREVVAADMEERDRRDVTRAEAPLVRAPDAVLVDTTGMTAHAVLATLVDHVRRRLGTPPPCA
jgi:cytidylate kinase